MLGPGTKWCDEQLPRLRRAILQERIDSYKEGKAAGRWEAAREAAALIPDSKSALAKRIRRLGRVKGGVRRGK